MGIPIPNKIFYDTVTVLSKQVASNNQVILRVVESFIDYDWMSNRPDTLKIFRDTIEWVFTGTRFLVSNKNPTYRDCDCYDGILKYLIYNDCSVNASYLAENREFTGIGDTNTLPPFDSTIKVESKSIITNKCIALQNDTVNFNSQQISTKVSESVVSHRVVLLKPENVYFNDGSREKIQDDIRRVWSNDQYGIVRELVTRRIDGKVFGEISERTLVDFRVK
ncbi:MAG: hypothetical protein JNL32_13045 [Candidatus Kapabacteria bacterium]|nr:hypothetical protein [Candidatus Kapabacteria bacterium]